MTKSDAIKLVAGIALEVLKSVRKTPDAETEKLIFLVNILGDIARQDDDQLVDLSQYRLTESFPETLAKLGVTQTDIDKALKD